MIKQSAPPISNQEGFQWTFSQPTRGLSIHRTYCFLATIIYGAQGTPIKGWTLLITGITLVQPQAQPRHDPSTSGPEIWSRVQGLEIPRRFKTWTLPCIPDWIFSRKVLLPNTSDKGVQKLLYRRKCFQPQILIVSQTRYKLPVFSWSILWLARSILGSSNMWERYWSLEPIKFCTKRLFSAKWHLPLGWDERMQEMAFPRWYRGIHARVCLPMNTYRWWSSQSRPSQVYCIETPCT